MRHSVAGKTVPALQRMVDYLDEAFADLESALDAAPPGPAAKSLKRTAAASASPVAHAATAANEGRTPRRRAVRKTPPA